MVRVAFGAWYEEGEVSLRFPEGWDISVYRPPSLPEAGEAALAQALAEPIGSRPLSKLAEGKRMAAIIVDDLTRPTPADRLIPWIIGELRKGGLRDDHVRFVMGIACHRPLVRDDLEKKLGAGIADSFEVLNHNPYENLEYLGPTSRGTPVYLNGDVYEADLRIGVGSVVPHPLAGFGGGAKIVLPGIVGIETIEHNHRKIASEGRHGSPETCPVRLDMEETAKIARLDMVVNTVVDERRRVAKVFAGDTVEAHREAVRSTRGVHRVSFQGKADILVANAYPIDSEFLQSPKALWAREAHLEPRGATVLVTASSEGFGHHYLVERERWRNRRREEGEGKPEPTGRLLIYSPNIGSKAARRIYPSSEVFKAWSEVLEELKNMYGQRAKVTLLTCAPIQYA